MAISSAQQQTLDLVLNIEAKGQEILASIDQQLKAMGLSLASADDSMKRASQASGQMNSSLQSVSASVKETGASFASASAITAQAAEVVTVSANKTAAAYRATAAASKVEIAQINADRAIEEALAERAIAVIQKDAAAAVQASAEKIAASKTTAIQINADREVEVEEIQKSVIALKLAGQAAAQSSIERIAASNAAAKQTVSDNLVAVASYKLLTSNSNKAATQIEADAVLQQSAYERAIVVLKLEGQEAAQTSAKQIAASNATAKQAVAAATEIAAAYKLEAAEAKITAEQVISARASEKFAHEEVILAMRQAGEAATQSAAQEVSANEKVMASLKSVRDAALETAASFRTMGESAIGSSIPELGVNLEDLARKVKLGVEAFGLLAGAIDIVSIGAAGKFQSEMNSIQGNTTLTDTGIKQLSVSLKDMAATSSSTIPQLSEGLMHIANLNYQGADAVNILTEANKSANATGASAASTSNILAGAMRDFNASADEAGHYMNVLHLVAAEGNMTLEQMNSVMGRVDAAASNMGVTLPEAGAAVSALTEHGYSFSQAGTQVVNILQHIVHPSQAAAKALSELGKATGVDLVGDFTAGGLASKQLDGVLGDLEKSFKKAGYSQAQASAAMFDLIPAMRGGLGAISLTGTAADDFKRILGDLNSTISGKTDPTTKAFSNTTQTLGFQMKELRNNAELAAIGLGDIFLHATTDAVKSLNTFTSGIGAHLEILSKWEERTHTVEGVLSGIGDKIKSAEPALKSLGNTILDNGKAFIQWAAMTNVLGLALGVVKGYIELVVGEVKNFADAITPGLTNLALLETKTNAVSNTMKDLGAVVGSVVGSVVNEILHLVGEFVQWEQQTHAIATAGDVLRAAISAISQVIDSIANAVGPVVASFVAWENKTKTLETILHNLADIVSTIVPILGQIAMAVTPVIQAVLGWLSNSDNLKIALIALAAVLSITVVPAIVGAAIAAAPLVALFGGITAALWVVTQAFKHWGDDANPVVNTIRAAIDRLANGFLTVMNFVIDCLNAFNRLTGATSVASAALTAMEQKAGVAAGTYNKFGNQIEHLSYVSMDYTHVVDDATAAQNNMAASMDKINTVMATSDGTIAKLVPGYLAMSTGAQQASVAHERLDEVSKILFDQTFAGASDKINKIIPGYSAMSTSAQTAAVTQYELANASGDLGTKLDTLASKAGVTVEKVNQLQPIGDLISSSFSAAGEAANTLTTTFDAMTTATLTGMTQWASDVDAALQATDTQLAEHGEKGPQLYIDAYAANKPLLQQIATELGRAGVTGVAGILPAYAQEGQLAGHDYVVGLELNYAASKNATLRMALNAVEGLATSKQFSGPQGLITATNYISGIMSQLGLSTSAGTSLSSAALKGAEGVIPAMGAIGAAARAAFIAGLQGKGAFSGGIGDNTITSGVGGAGAENAISAFDMSATKNGGITQEYQNTAVLDAIKQATKIYDTAVTKTPQDKQKSDTDTKDDPLKSGGGGGGGGGGSPKAGKAAKETDPVTEAIKRAEEMGKAAEALQKVREYTRISGTSMDAIVADIMAMNDKMTDAASRYSEEMNKSTTMYAETTAKVGEGVAKMADGLSKVRGYITVGKTAMDSFFGDSFYITDKFAEAGKAYGTDMMSWAAEYATTTIKVGEAIDKVAGGLAKIRGYATVGKTSMDAFVSDTAYITGQFANQGRNYTVEMSDAAIKFALTTEKVGAAIEKMAAGLVKLRNYSSLGATSMDAFVADTAYLTGKFVDQGKNYSDDMVKWAQSYAAVTEKVGSAIDKMATGLLKLKNYSQLSANSIEDFTADMRRVISKFVDAGREYDTQMKEQATSFAAVTEKVGTAIEKMAAGLLKLKNYSQIGFDAIENFVADTRRIIQKFVEAGSEYNTTMQEQAQAFSKTTAEVGDSVVKMAAGLVKLKDYSQVGGDAIGRFADDVGVLMMQFRDLAAKFDTEMQTSMKTFGDTTDKVSAGVLKSVEALTKMKDYAKVPAQSFNAFMADLEDLMNRIADAASKFKGDIPKTEEFGKAISDVFGGLANATKTFVDLQAFQEVPTAIIDKFIASVLYVVQKVSETNPKLQAASIAMIPFATSVKDIFTALSDAIKTFLELEKIKTIDTKVIDYVINSMRYSITQVSILADMPAEIVTKAKNFSDRCKDIFTNLDNAIKFFDGLSKIKDMPDVLIAKLVTSMGSVLTQSAALEQQSKDILGHAASYASNMAQAASDFAKGANAAIPTSASGSGAAASPNTGTPASDGGMTRNEPAPVASANVMMRPHALGGPTSIIGTDAGSLGATDAEAKTLDLINRALDIAEKMAKAIATINSAGTISNTALDNFIAMTSQVVRRMITAGAEFGDTALAAANKYSEAAIKASEVLIKGVEAFKAISNYVQVDGAKIWALGQNLRELIGNFAGAVTEGGKGTADALAGAIQFADAAGKVVSVILSAVQGFATLAGYTQVGRTSIDNFFKDIWYITALMSYPLSNSIALALAGASAFATSAKLVTDTIKTGVEGFALLINYTQVGRTQINKFFDDLWYITSLMAYPLNVAITAALAGASAFAATAKLVVETVKPGVEAFGLLGNYSGLARSNTQLFLADLISFVADFYATIVGNFAPKSLEAAAAVADSIGKMLAPIKSAVDTLAALRGYAQVARGTLQIFFADLQQTLILLEAASGKFTKDNATLLVNFGEGITKSFDGLVKAVDLFIKLKDYASIPQVAVKAFFDSMAVVINMTVALATSSSGQLTPAVTAFSTALAGLFDMLKKSLDVFDQINKSAATPAIAIQHLFDNLATAVTGMASLNDEATLYYNGAVTFAQIMAAANQQLLNGITGNAGTGGTPQLAGGVSMSVSSRQGGSSSNASSQSNGASVSGDTYNIYLSNGTKVDDREWTARAEEIASKIIEQKQRRSTTIGIGLGRG